MRWETVGEWTQLRELHEGELFSTATDINRWQKGKFNRPRILERGPDPYWSPFPAPLNRASVATSPSQKVIRVQEKA